MITDYVRARLIILKKCETKTISENYRQDLLKEVLKKTSLSKLIKVTVF